MKWCSSLAKRGSSTFNSSSEITTATKLSESRTATALTLEQTRT